MDGVVFDFRHALRGLQRDRAFVLTAVATLAVAIALNVVVFTIRDAMLFRGLPLAERSDRLVYIAMRKPSDLPCCPGPVRYADFEVWRGQARSFEGLTFGRRNEPIAFRAGSSRLLDMMVSRHTTNTLSLLGVRPILGRDFAERDATAGAPAVVIISHQFWETRLGKREDVVGLAVQVNGVPASVIGVLPENFALVYQQDLFMPLAHTSAPMEGGVIGRLRDDATAEQARAELDTIVRAMQAADPATVRGVPSVLDYAHAHVAPDAPRIYGSLWAGAWFVLLIACANLANLTLVRTTGRWREFSTRLALGARPSRMVRQMLIEHVVLAGAAAAIAWPIVKWSLRTWANRTASPYLALDFSVTLGTLVYVVSIAAVAAILVAVLPMSRVMQLGLNETLKGDARGVTHGPRGRRLTTSLVAVQMALAIVLLLGAGVLVRSFASIVGADTGVPDAERITSGLVGLPSDKYPTPESRAEFFARLDARLRTIAETHDVAIASTIPIRGSRLRRFEVSDRLNAPDGEHAQVTTVSPNYFRTLGRPTISGRDFNDGDDLAAPLVVMVNESFSATYWPGNQPLGNRLRLVDGGVAGPWRTVVGIVPNIMQGDATRQTFKPVIYVPFSQQPSARAFIFVRTAVPPTQMIQAVLADVQRLDADVITEQFSSLEAKFAFDRDWMDLEHADLGKHAAIAPIFAVVALVLAAVGLMAVIGYSVSQRTKEIGVRMAIGAAQQDIARMIVREGMRPVALGVFAGLVAAAGANRLLQSQLVGVSPYDPLTMAAAPIILVVVALIGCRIPARRAMRVDPVVALRHE